MAKGIDIDIDADNDEKDHEFASASSASVTLWVGGTSALAQTYVEEILRYNPQRENATATDSNNNNNKKKPSGRRRFVLASPDPPHEDFYRWFSDSTISSSSCTTITQLALDMTKKDSIDAFLDGFLGDETSKTLGTVGRTLVTVIFGMRSSLVTGSKEEHASLTKYLAYFLEEAVSRFSAATAAADGRRWVLAGVLHVSSVAVMDHTTRQAMLDEEAPLPTRYSSPYDAMKRETEDILTSTCQSRKIPQWVHLRISGIFSNEVPPTRCIQMGAIRLQAHVGSYLQTPLDMNTSFNVCQAMRLLLDKMDDCMDKNNNNDEAPTPSPTGLGHVYFYTRPTLAPRPYGDNLVAYRSAHNILYAMDIPDRLARSVLWAIILLFRGMAAAGSTLGNTPPAKWVARVCDLLGNVAYLLTVSMVEHTFDNSRIRREFPELNNLEESVLEGFVRIQNRHRQRQRQRNARVPKIKFL